VRSWGRGFVVAYNGISCPLSVNYKRCPEFRKNCDGINCEANKEVRNKSSLLKQCEECEGSGMSGPCNAGFDCSECHATGKVKK
jgi:hypothetical protein